MDRKTPKLIFGIILVVFANDFFAQTRAVPPAFGFVSLTTIQAPIQPNSLASFAPGVVVRFKRKDNVSENLAMTVKQGIALVPLRAAAFCAQAFGSDGQRLAIDSRSLKEHLCFVVQPGQIVEFTLTIAAGVNYSRKIPTLGID
jgi:hypothetical protein